MLAFTMHFINLMRILKRDLYWLHIFLVIIFISCISASLGATNKTNTTFNIENNNQSNKSKDNMEDLNVLYNFYIKIIYKLTVGIFVILIMLCILFLIGGFYLILRRCRRRIYRFPPTTPSNTSFAGVRVAIGENEVQQQLVEI
ncbi:uncharacterized protein LOC114938322 [Nylanderia fulva]|uniref:uncharacterized protein LOC114938322 n=1 Tax=Nylanderia fulva TaxID=613905 RepID=UPI0010FB235D|nr:uncharacterized protein LOC114938322 [Nylanderia fulva]